MVARLEPVGKSGIDHLGHEQVLGRVSDTWQCLRQAWIGRKNGLVVGLMISFILSRVEPAFEKVRDRKRAAAY